MADFEADFPPVVPGTEVLVQLKHRKVRSAETGEVIQHLPAEPFRMTVKDRESCYPEAWHLDYETVEEAMHAETICTECIAEWALDYYISLTEPE